MDTLLILHGLAVFLVRNGFTWGRVSIPKWGFNLSSDLHIDEFSSLLDFECFKNYVGLNYSMIHIYVPCVNFSVDASNAGIWAHINGTSCFSKSEFFSLYEPDYEYKILEFIKSIRVVDKGWVSYYDHEFECY